MLHFMKKCSSCLDTLPLTEFSVKVDDKTGVRSCCKSCQRRYAKEHYIKNKKKYFLKAKKHNKNVKRKYWELKSGLKCLDCGVSFPNEPWLIEFDHLGDKVCNVSGLAQQGKSLALEKEIKKCQPVCVICHRRRTARRSGWSFG